MAPVTSSGPNSTLSPESKSTEGTRPDSPEEHPKNREPTPPRIEEQIDSLRKFTRSQVISSIAQLEEKKYVECSSKGCRFIALTIGEMAMHLPRCQGSRGNDRLLGCKYCPHGTTSHDALTNHTILSHPYALEVLKKSAKGLKFVVNESEKELFRSSNEVRRIFKSHWRTCLQTKGYILCLNPLCHHVTCLIPEMEDHFLKCRPEIWELLNFSCEKCCGRTFSEKLLAAHMGECHPSTDNSHYSPYKSADRNTIAFWDRCLKAYGVSKCCTENCQLVSYNINELKKHHRYCRVPHAENHEVCRACGAWFESLEGLGEHKQRFGKDSKLYQCRKIMHTLRNLSVDSSDFPLPEVFTQLQNRGAVWSLESVASCDIAPEVKLALNNAVPNIPIKVEELKETQKSFLQDLGRAIENECDGASYQKIELSINGNERSWKMEVEAPSADKAAQVVNRKMPSYSLKRIVAESLEESLNLLKRSSIATRVENIASRPYVPPKPLDFVSDDLDTLSVLRKKFVGPVTESSKSPKGPLHPIIPSPTFTLEDEIDHDPKRATSNKGRRMRRVSGNDHALFEEDLISADNPRPIAKKLNRVRDFLPKQHSATQKPNILRSYNKKYSRALKSTVVAKSNESSNVRGPKTDPVPNAVTIKPGTDKYKRIQEILAGWNVPPGTPVVVKSVKKGPGGKLTTVNILTLDDCQQSPLRTYSSRPPDRPVAHPPVPKSCQISDQASTSDPLENHIVSNLGECRDNQPVKSAPECLERVNNRSQNGISVYNRPQLAFNITNVSLQVEQERESLLNHSFEANTNPAILSEVSRYRIVNGRDSISTHYSSEGPSYVGVDTLRNEQVNGSLLHPWSEANYDVIPIGKPSTTSDPSQSFLEKRMTQKRTFHNSCSDTFDPSDEPPCKIRAYSATPTVPGKAYPIAFSDHARHNSSGSISDVTLCETQRSESPIPFELPTLPPTKQVIFGSSTPIPDYYHKEISAQRSPQSVYRPYTPNLRTYLRKTAHGQFQGCHKSVLPKLERISPIPDEGIFVEEPPIVGDGPCTDVSYKTEPGDDIGSDTETKSDVHDLFGGSLGFIDDPVGNGNLLLPDVFLDTGTFVRGGLFNDRSPWEITKTKEKTRKNAHVIASNSYRGSKLRESSQIDQSENRDVLNDSTYECSLKDDREKKSHVTDESRLKDLASYLTDVERRTYKNEPLVYMVKKVYTYADLAKITRPTRASNVKPSGLPESGDEAGKSGGNDNESKGNKAEEEGSSRGKRKRQSEPQKIKAEDSALGEDVSHRPKALEEVKPPVGRRKRKCKPLKVTVDGEEPGEGESSENGSKPVDSVDGVSILPKKRSSRSKNSVGHPQPSASNGLGLPAASVDFNDPQHDSLGEPESVQPVTVPRKRGRPLKRRGRGRPRPDYTPCLEQDPLGEDCPDDPNDQNFLYVDGDQYYESDALVPAAYRIQYNTVLTHPLRIVTCAICDESMTACAYKKNHLDTHNHLCWLKGEEPMDFNDERTLERHLYNVYINTRIIFTCEKCQKGCKSAKGFLSHRKFCGKSVKERQEMMVKCKVCSRMMKPSSLLNHMNTIHPPGPPSQELLSGTRLAATKCLGNISTTVQDLQNQEPYVDENEEKKAAEEHKWIRSGYTFSKRRVFRDTRSLFEASMEETGELKCLVPGCSHVETSINLMMEHYRTCDSESLDFKCITCNFVSSREALMINHVRTSHQNKVEEFLGNKSLDVSDLSGTFIPYMKAGELQSRSLLYLQPALKWTHEMRRTFLATEKLYPDWMTFGPMESLDDFPESYFELKDESMRISFVSNQSNSPEWITLRKLTSLKFDNDGLVLFTGGIVRSFDWFPCTSKQHIVISVGNIESEGINLKSTHSAPGHFQIWSAGSLENFSTSYDADLKFEFAVCHEFGEVWDVKCCPAGTTDGRRLGLVALATSSGKVPVYTIPLLETSSNKACKLIPVVVLELGLDESFQVTRVAWSKTKPHRFVAAGFSNGLVGVWDLTTSSSLLKSNGSLMPFKLFHAHFTTITGLSFSPVSEYYLVTACTEKSSKYWHLEDTSIPQTEFTRGLAMDVEWIQHWMSTVAAIDDTYTIGTTTACINPIRNFVFAHQPVITQADSCANTVAVNDWINAYVCGYDSGQILLSLAFKLRQSQDDRKRVHSLFLAADFHKVDPGSKEIFDGKSYASTSEHFGIIFRHNFSVNHSSKIKPHPCKDLMYFPATAANKVCWNTNPNSFLTLATGFHSGFVVLSRLRLPKNEANELVNILENLCIT